MLYFNTPANGILDPDCKAVLDEFYAAQYSDPAGYFMDWMINKKDGLKSKLARFIGCDDGELALVPNSSFAISSFCSGLPPKTKAMMLDLEYPSLYEPFRLQGFDMYKFSATDNYSWDMEALKDELVHLDIDVLAISHCQYLTGYLADLKDLGTFCREREIMFFVDATQSMGAEPIQMHDMNIDVLVASNYKWMNAGLGSAVMAISIEYQNKYPAKIGGFGSYVPTERGFEYRSSIRSYEPGHLALASLLCLEVTLNKRSLVNVLKIQEHNHGVAQLFRDGLKERGITFPGQSAPSSEHSAIVVADMDEADYARLQQMQVSVAFRGGRSRFGFHYHNTKEEIIEFFRRWDA